MYKYDLHKKVQKFLNKTDAHIVDSFYEKVHILCKDPRAKTLDVSKLQGSDDSYRLRIGKYRFLYTIIEDKILIYFFEADGRGDVYK